MSTDPVRVPQGKDAEARWARLRRRDRLAILFQGKYPTDPDEAVAVLGYGRRMMERSLLLGLLGGLGAMAIGVGLGLLIGDGLMTSSLVRAAGVGLGVGLGMGVSARVNGRSLERRASETLYEAR